MSRMRVTTAVAIAPSDEGGASTDRGVVRLSSCEVEPLSDSWADVTVAGLVGPRGFEAVVRVRLERGAWVAAHVESWGACPAVKRYTTELRHQKVVAERVVRAMFRWARIPENAELLQAAGQRARHRKGLELERELASAEATVARLRDLETHLGASGVGRPGHEEHRPGGVAACSERAEPAHLQQVAGTRPLRRR